MDDYYVFFEVTLLSECVEAKMADERSATVVLSEVVSDVTWLIEEHATVLVHTLKVELVLLGLWVEVFVDLVPFWWDTIKFFVWSYWYQGGFSLAHLVYHLVDILEVFSPVELAQALLGCLWLELIRAGVFRVGASAFVATWVSWD